MRLVALSGMIAATAFSAAAAQETAEPPATTVESTAQSAPVAAASASVRTVSPLETALAPYAVYQQDVSTLRGLDLRSTADMDAAVEMGANHHYPALASGVIAYGALAAAQSPAFVQAARDAEAYYGRAGLVSQLTSAPHIAAELRGADDARQLAAGAVMSDVRRVARVADRYRDLGASLAQQRWGRAAIRNKSERDAELSALGAPSAQRAASQQVTARLYAAPATFAAAAHDPGALGGEAFWDRVTGAPTTFLMASSSVVEYWRPDPQRQRAVDNMLALGALHAIGAETDRPEAFGTLIQERLLASCFAAAQSAFLGCQQSNGRQHEGAFCLATHALGWERGPITVNSVALCMSRLFQTAPPAGAGMTPIAQNASLRPAE